MGKHNTLKFLKTTKARTSYICDLCRRKIVRGEIYYPESIGRVDAPRIKLKKFCKECVEKFKNQLPPVKILIEKGGENMTEKISCIYYKKKKVQDKSSYGSIAASVDIVEIPYCTHPKVDDQSGSLPCEECQYSKKDE